MTPRSDHRSTILWLAATTALFLSSVSNAGADDPFVASVRNDTVFYRLQTHYLHGVEPIDFDIVVACGVRITKYKDSDSSYDAAWTPGFFVKETAEGDAVMQLVPNACRGETTGDPKNPIPDDLLPGAIWFDRENKFILGTGYFFEAAFEQPDSKLRFRGATISRASKKDWLAFQPTAAQNQVSETPYRRGVPSPTPAEVAANGWNRDKLLAWDPVIACYGVARYHLSDPAAQAIVRRYWPVSHPRFWSPATPSDPDPSARISAVFDELQATAVHGPLVDGRPFRAYFRNEEALGFPTRRGGGIIEYSGLLPIEVFPMRAGEGLPWAGPNLGTATTIYRDVDMDGGRKAGYLSCYPSLHPGDGAMKTLIPDYFTRHFQTRIDGEPIQGQQTVGPIQLYPYFENDEYFFLQFHVAF